MGIMDEAGLPRQAGICIPGRGRRVPSLAVGTQDTTAVRIGLHDVAALRWPKRPVSGDGPREIVPVPLPRLPWARTAIEVPLGASAARGVERVIRLRKIFGYVVAPVVIVLFLVADALLIWSLVGDFDPPRRLFAVMGAAGVLLILTGKIPDAVARANGTPYVSRGVLHLPAARTDAVRQLVKLNPKAAIDTR
jgi:hypothetical protein